MINHPIAVFSHSFFVVFDEIVVPPPPQAVQSFDGTGPRLMISHIVNENFKSYAGKQTLGPFHKVLLMSI